MRRIFGALALVVLLCGCPSKSYHDAVVAEHTFTVSLQSFQQAEVVEFHAGRISAAEHQKLEKTIGQAAQAAQVLVSSLQSGANNATVQQNFATVGQAVQTLLNTGIIPIKNLQSQAALRTALQVVQAVLANVATLLNGAS